MIASAILGLWSEEPTPEQLAHGSVATMPNLAEAPPQPWPTPTHARLVETASGDDTGWMLIHDDDAHAIARMEDDGNCHGE